MNKTVKKVLIVCICVVLIVGVAGAIWFWDMTRVIESPYPEIVAIGKNMNKNGAVAYSVTESKDKIVVTNYCTAGIVKSIVTYNLENDVVKIDGNMAIAWSGSLNFTVEKSSKSLLGSAVSGEGLVNVYRGTGKILMAPTA